MKAANAIIFQTNNRGFNSAINIRVIWIKCCNAAESLRKEKKSQDSRNSENDWKGRTRYNQQRKKKNNGSRSRSRSNNQHNTHKPSTNKPIENEKKEWPTPAEASKEERRKERPFFLKVRPYKQRQKERFETVEIKNYDESDTNNNDQQNEHTIIVSDTQDVPNQVEENVNNSVRDNFFSSWPRCNKSQPKEELIIHPKVLNLSSVSLTPSQIQILTKGLKFTPTPQRNLPEMGKDIKDFARKLRLVEFFSENT